MAGTIQNQATAIGQRLVGDSNLGFVIPPALIIAAAQLLLQFLGECWKTSPPAGLTGSANPSDYLRDHYDAGTGEFEPFILQQTRGQSRRAIRIAHRNGQGAALNQWTPDQINAMSTQSLLQVMNTPTVSQSALAEIHS